MQNPCHTCLLVNNCTAICEVKENLRILLKDTVLNYQRRIHNSSTTDFIRRYTFWRKLKKQNDEDIVRIRLRAMKLKDFI